MPRRTVASDQIRCNWLLLSDQARENSQSKTLKPKLTFVIVGKRFIGCIGSHWVDGKYLGIIFIFSRWMECSSVSFMFDLLVRLTDYFFRGADGTRNFPAGFMADWGVQSLTTHDFYLQYNHAEASEEVSCLMMSLGLYLCSSILFFS